MPGINVRSLVGGTDALRIKSGRLLQSSFYRQLMLMTSRKQISETMQLLLILRSRVMQQNLNHADITGNPSLTKNRIFYKRHVH